MSFNTDEEKRSIKPAVAGLHALEAMGDLQKGGNGIPDSGIRQLHFLAPEVIQANRIELAYRRVNLEMEARILPVERVTMRNAEE